MQEFTIVEDAVSRRWLADSMVGTPWTVFKWSAPLVVVVGAVIVMAGYASRRVVGLLILTIGAPAVISGGIIAAYPVVRWLPQNWTIDTTGIRGRGGRQFGSIPWSAIKSWAVSEASSLPGYSHAQFEWKTSWRQGRLDVVVPPGIRPTVIEEYCRVCALTAQRTDIQRAIR
jgi:hypothetical protein